MSVPLKRKEGWGHYYGRTLWAGICEWNAWRLAWRCAMRKTTLRGFLESTGKAVTATVVGAELFGAGRAFGGPCLCGGIVEEMKADEKS